MTELETIDTLSDLAHHVRKLTGPSRETDLAIVRHVANIGGPAENALPYTASLDAALTLVPEGSDWSIRSLLEDCERVNARCRKRGVTCWHVSHSPALALCVAAILLWEEILNDFPRESTN